VLGIREERERGEEKEEKRAIARLRHSGGGWAGGADQRAWLNENREEQIPMWEGGTGEDTWCERFCSVMDG
jgi:hypothetical protein